MLFDILLQNCRIIDGTGAPCYRGHVGIVRGNIVAVGKRESSPQLRARRVIDCGDKVVCPGFIDMHSHDDLSLIANPKSEPKVTQGVTTQVIGNCGISFAPADEVSLRALRRMYAAALGDPDIEWNWTSVAEYLQRLAGCTCTNVVFLVGHAALRQAAMGMQDRVAAEDEIRIMKRLAGQALSEGAWGLSTGLTYVPGCFSATDELVEVGHVVSEFGGIYCTHIRNYAEGIRGAIEEALAIGRAARIPVHISHLQTVGQEMKGHSQSILEALERARDSGIDVTFDSYPYTAGAGMLHSILPSWVQAGGPDELLRRLSALSVRDRLRMEMPESSPVWRGTAIGSVANQDSKGTEGRRLSDLAMIEGRHPVDVLCDLLLSNGLKISQVNFMGNEEDVVCFMQSPLQMFGSDGVYAPGNPHPRLWGTYARVLGVYVRERKVLGIEEAIRKMTSAPATRLGLKDRGLIKEGFAADLVVFDPDVIRDQATFEKGDVPALGIEYVFVNGQMVIDRGKPTGALAGKVLRR